MRTRKIKISPGCRRSQSLKTGTSACAWRIFLRARSRSTMTLTTRKTRWCLSFYRSFTIPWLRVIAKIFKGISVGREIVSELAGGALRRRLPRTDQRPASSSQGEYCVFVSRSLNISGCCVAVSQVKTRCLTVRCKSLPREDNCGNSRDVCLKTILVTQVRIP